MREREDQAVTARRGRAIGVLGGVASLLLVAVLLITPFGALGKPGPIRGQGTIADPEPSETARAFWSNANQQPAPAADPLGGSVRSRVAAESDPAQPGRRPRPDPAPVSLAPTPAAEPKPAPVETQARRRPAPEPDRIWPLQAGSFQMSQPFGCVPQLSGFYPVVSGCPPEAPAVHSGLDLAASEGTPIFAAAAGWVTMAGYDRAGGVANTQIVIQHDGVNEGYATEYYHWIRTYVQPGDYVRAGELIAEVGSVGYSTGPHLHFSVVDFARDERIDPVRWLPASPESAVYAGRTPERAPISFASVNVPTPDYADPAPPAVPNEQAVPDAAPASAPEPAAETAPTTVAPTAETAPPDSGPAPTAVPAAPTPVPTAHTDQASDAGTSGPAPDQDGGKKKRDREAPPATEEPSVQVPPPVPPVPANPNVAAPTPAPDAIASDDTNGKRKKRNR